MKGGRNTSINVRWSHNKNLSFAALETAASYAVLSGTNLNACMAINKYKKHSKPAQV